MDHAVTALQRLGLIGHGFGGQHLQDHLVLRRGRDDELQVQAGRHGPVHDAAHQFQRIAGRGQHHIAGDVQGRAVAHAGHAVDPGRPAGAFKNGALHGGLRGQFVELGRCRLRGGFSGRFARLAGGQQAERQARGPGFQSDCHLHPPLVRLATGYSRAWRKQVGRKALAGETGLQYPPAAPSLRISVAAIQAPDSKSRMMAW